jgi:uncharacterized protein YbbK (DUF523 family)
MDLTARFSLLHSSDTEAARAELRRIADSPREVVLVSACLCGIPCTFDGRDREKPTVLAAEADGAEILPLCPEVLGRMGTPRAEVRLSADGKHALVGAGDGKDVTETVDAGARLADLFAQQGNAKRAILCEGTASCGVSKVLGSDGAADGVGRFTARLQKRGLPLVGR